MWDLTADRPFRTEGPNGPEGAVTSPQSAARRGADQLCVTVADDQHRTDNPEVFHCFPVPDA